jgi:multidrug efflux pump subunit AcrB
LGYSSFLIPREEEPQIIVPMADVMVGYPERAYRGRKPCGETFGENHLKYSKVEHIHTMAMNGQALLIVQFYVGEDVERSYVKLYDELAKHEDMFQKECINLW